jgi:hypothetical protein
VRFTAALTIAAVLAGCGRDEGRPLLRAYRAVARDQLVGGVAAVADVGDFVLENDAVRFVILDGHGSPGPGIFGGSLADADLQRTERTFRGGHGLDSFSELFPFANLATPHPESTEVTIEEDGADGKEAVVTVTAMADDYMKALEILDFLSLNSNVRFVTRYKLRRHERVLRIATSLEFDPSPGGRATEPLEGLVAPPNIFEIILRVPPKPITQGVGTVAGDFLFFGDKNDVFTPGYGFDFDFKLREIFNGGCDSVNVPVGVPAIAAEGDRVSYAYASGDPEGGKVFVPLFASSFTAVMTHKKECTGAGNCLGESVFTWERLFSVGDGDAASALRELYRVKNVPTGELVGHVFDARTGQALSGIRVFAVRDPGPEVVSDAELSTAREAAAVERILEAAYQANRDATKRPCTKPKPEDCLPCAPEIDPYGEPGIAASMKTDRGTDPVLDGDFSAALEPGDYLVFARDRLRAPSAPQRVRIVKGETANVVIALERPGELLVRVTDESGRPMPGKVTLGRCLPECVRSADCAARHYCDPGQRRCFPNDVKAAGALKSYESCGPDACRCDAGSALDVALGDPLNPDHILATAFAGPDGVARLRARPGDYEVIVSRGPEFDVARRQVTLDPRRPSEAQAMLRRVVDTRGWISADFHVHGMFSHDSNVTHERRVLSMMGEGVELVSSSDHDAIVDFAPTVRALGAQRFIQTQIGLETTTVEMGHFLGHPLRFNELATFRNGAFDWYGLPPGRASYCDDDGDRAFDPRRDRLVPEGDPNGACGSVEVRRDPGIIGRLRELGLLGPGKTVVTVPHPRDGFFGYFDQFAINAFTFEFEADGNLLEKFNPLTQPAYFSTEFDAIELLNGKRLELVRTPTIAEVSGYDADMKALRALRLPNSELERRTAAVSDAWMRRILRREPEEQRRVLAANGRVSCSPQRCDEVTRSCGGDLLCDFATDECYQPCSADRACEDRFGECDLSLGRCVRPPDEPCTAHRGVLDDWFRLLNGGLAKTGLGNSDTHGVLSVESGLPRNWVASRTDEPAHIDLADIAERTLERQVMTGYGPFLRMDANGVGIGGTLTRPQGAVKLHVAVESPLWFDVDRLEIYRNGELWQVVEAGAKTPACTTVDAVPNRSIVNFDCTFEDAAGEDAWFVAVAMGLTGKDLRPVYSSVPIRHLEIGEITGRAFGALGLPVGRPEVPREFPVLPYALTNPIWVDHAGDGFDAPRPLSERSPFQPRGRGEFPLSSAAIGGPPLPVPVLPAQDTPGRAAAALQRQLRRAMEVHHARER